MDCKNVRRCIRLYSPVAMAGPVIAHWPCIAAGLHLLDATGEFLEIHLTGNNVPDTTRGAVDQPLRERHLQFRGEDLRFGYRVEG